jgi:hypothetical protein
MNCLTLWSGCCVLYDAIYVLHSLVAWEVTEIVKG